MAMGVPNSWMVSVRENPNPKWMMTGYYDLWNPLFFPHRGQDGRPPMASSPVVPWPFGIAAATSGATGSTWHLGEVEVACGSAGACWRERLYIYIYTFYTQGILYM